MTDTNSLNSVVNRPTSRAARQSAIEYALQSYIVTSQQQLSTILANDGIEVTQATLSRDLDEMKATKRRNADGVVSYALPTTDIVSSSHTPSAYRRMLEGEQDGHNVAFNKVEMQIGRAITGLVTSVASAKNLVVIHTPAGAAQYVASTLDKQYLEDVLGTIAGDDTIMVITSDERCARTRAEWLLTLASGE